MEKDICEPYRALKDGLKAVRDSEVILVIWLLSIWLIPDFSFSAERNSWYGEHPEQELGKSFQDWAPWKVVRGKTHNVTT